MDGEVDVVAGVLSLSRKALAINDAELARHILSSKQHLVVERGTVDQKAEFALLASASDLRS